MTKMRIGVILTKANLRAVVNAFRMRDDAEISAIFCDGLSPDSSELTDKDSALDADFFEDATVYTDAEEFFAEGDFDFVYLANNALDHAYYLELALAYDKRVLLDQFIAGDYVDSMRFLRDFSNQEQFLVMNFPLRYSPYLEKLRHMVTSGELGNIYSFELNWRVDPLDLSYLVPANFAKQSARLSVMSHAVDLMQYLFGRRMIHSANAFMSPIDLEEDLGSDSLFCAAHFNLADEMTAYLSVDMQSHFEPTFDLKISASKKSVRYLATPRIEKLESYQDGAAELLTADLNEEAMDDAMPCSAVLYGAEKRFLPLAIKAFNGSDVVALKASAGIEELKEDVEILEAIARSSNEYLPAFVKPLRPGRM